MASVYIHINMINNKKYIGSSKHDFPESRWGQNGMGYEKQRFYQEGIEPFGWDNFIHKILIKEIPLSLAQTLEFLLIKNLSLIDNGYNEDPGVFYNNDKEMAMKILPNLLDTIKREENNKKNNLTSLSDIVNVSYKSRTMTYRLSYLFDLYKNNKINTSLDCQREYVWDEQRQQNMWDTILYGHRIPELHAINCDNGVYEIIDGKQRLLTLMKILNNEIPVKRAYASDEIKTYMVNNNINHLYFKDVGEIMQYKINNTEINVAEYEGVDEQMLITLFQKLNSGKALTEFQKHIANNIIVKVHYTQPFYTNTYIQALFTQAERSSNEDEIFLIRLFSALNCDKIENIGSLCQRDLDKVIEKMETPILTKTKEKILNIINEFNDLNITPEIVSKIRKTWYPVLFKFYNDEIATEDKKYFKDFIPTIYIPPQRGQESTKNTTIARYYSIKKDWEKYKREMEKK